MCKLAIQGGEPVRAAPFPSWPAASGGEEEHIREVLATHEWGGQHPFVERFEQLFASLHDCQHGVAVSSGTVALEAALEAAGVGQGDEVIVPAHSFIATASAVTRIGAIPVFVDIERDTYNLDPTQLEAAASDRTSAVIPVHFGGVIAEMDKIAEIAAARSWTVIEDAAHAHGAEWHGRRAGSIGAAGVFSFQNSKVMTAGEGGIVVTSDGGLAQRVRSLADSGRREGAGWFEHFERASNYRMTGLQAAVLLDQLERLADQNRRRQRNVNALLESFEVPGLTFQRPPEGAVIRTNYLLAGRIQEKLFGATRDDFVAAMNAEGIPCRPFYPHPLYANPMFKEVAYRKLACPVAEAACRDSFWLGHRLFLGSEEDALDIRRAIEKIHEAYKPVAAQAVN